jgi:TIR domain
MSKVFISYSQSDRDKVAQFVQALQMVNITGWLDATDIAAGDDISSAVRNALSGASAVLVFLSNNALSSRWVQFEIGAAEALEKRIIPVILSGTEPREGLPDILKDRRFIDARNRPPSLVVEEIRRVLEREN